MRYTVFQILKFNVVFTMEYFYSFKVYVLSDPHLLIVTSIKGILVSFHEYWKVYSQYVSMFVHQ